MDFLATEKDELPGNIPKINQHFNVVAKIGEGAFSGVFLAELNNRPSADRIALKYIIPTSHPGRIANEVKCLKNLGGKSNVIRLHFAIRYGDRIALAMPYFPHDRFQDYFNDLTVEEIRDYMRNLLIALAHVHSFNIIHRDIKPSNFLYNRTLKKYRLVDFGLCQKCKSDINPPPPKRSITDENDIKNNEGKSKRRLPDATPEKKNGTLPPNAKRVALSPLTTNINSQMRTKSACQIRRPLFTTGKEATEKIQKITKSIIGFTRLDLNHSSLENLKVSCLDKNKQNCFQDKIKMKALMEDSKKLKRLKSSENICFCYGINQVCRVCLHRKHSNSPRAGTSGFRAPEVLLQCTNQTTGLDIWSGGVIFLSLLSRCFPFFTNTDDMASLGEIMTLFGTNALKESATKMGIQLTTSPNKPPLNLKKLCKRLQCAKFCDPNAPKCKQCGHQVIEGDCVCLNRQETRQDVCDSDEMPENAFNLLQQMLTLDPNARITAATSLSHSFFKF